MKTIQLTTIVFLLAGAAVAAEPASENMNTFSTYLSTGYDQVYRPQFHFTSRRNWINDPNGMVHYDGEYHLFFQHNPLGNTWRNMTWGHAVSTDMIHWKQIDHAIMPFQGPPAESKLLAIN